MKVASGLSDALGYHYRRPGAAHDGVIRIATTKPMAKLNSKMLHRVDRLVLKFTRGRATATSAMTGLPVVFLTTTGAQSGLLRTVPLLGIPVGSTLALIGTGFGQRPTPGWVHNLHAQPAATLTYRDRSASVIARNIKGEEADTVWQAASSIYPGYTHYPVWASHREISVFVLEAIND